MSSPIPAEYPAGAEGEAGSAGRPRGFGSPYLHYLILVFFLANLLVAMDRAVLGVLIVPIQAELGFTDTQLGALSFAFAVFYALFGLALGRLTDTGSRARLLAWSVGLLGLATSLCGAAHGFVQLFAARMFCGIGEAGSVPTKYSIIGDSFQPARRASALSLIYSGLAVGPPLGLMIAGPMTGAIGWRWTFLAFGLPSLLLGLLIHVTIREPRRGVFENVPERADIGMIATMRALARNRTFMAIVGAYSISTFGVYGLGYWIPAFLIRAHGLSLSEIGLVYGSVVGLGMIAGLLVGALVSAALARRDRRFEMWLPGVMTILAGAAYAAMFLTPSRDLALALSGIATFMMGVMVGPATAGIQSTVPARMRGVAAAITMFASALFGQGLGPWAIGYGSDLLAPSRSTASLGVMLLWSTSVFLIGGLLYLAGTLSFERDRVD
jgi:predicted MFS family arabinose efflux permease